MAGKRELAALLAGLLLAGCGAQVHSDAPSEVQVSAALKNSPGPLAALHVQADQLLAGGRSAFEARLASLRGYPVVINKWASWCGPCQSEFPVFQQVAVMFGRRVAFIGLDGRDADPAARAFLKRFPVPYPSYVDPNEEIARKLKAAVYFPQTIYLDQQGMRSYIHIGPYETVAALVHDIRVYLLRKA